MALDYGYREDIRFFQGVLPAWWARNSDVRGSTVRPAKRSAKKTNRQTVAVITVGLNMEFDPKSSWKKL